MQAIFKFPGLEVKTKLFYFFLLIPKEKWNFLLQARAKALLCFSLSFQQNIFWISYEILQRTSWIFLAALLP